MALLIVDRDINLILCCTDGPEGSVDFVGIADAWSMDEICAA